MLQTKCDACGKIVDGPGAHHHAIRGPVDPVVSNTKAAMTWADGAGRIMDVESLIKVVNLGERFHLCIPCRIKVLKAHADRLADKYEAWKSEQKKGGP